MAERAILGRTGLEVGRLGVAASYGAPAAAVEEAVERGVNYLYWGSMRRGGFGEALRNLAPRRERIVLVVQSYTRVAGLLAWSLERALRAARTEYTDVLLLGLWNRAPAPRILDAARALRERGLVRHLAVSTHKRPLVPALAGSDIGIFHVRYNAAHRGAERDIFPLLPAAGPGIAAFTATSWRQLLDPRRLPPGVPAATAGDCYRFVLSNPAVHICMSGPASTAEMRKALAAWEAGPLDEERLAWMRRVGDAVYRKKRA